MMKRFFAKIYRFLSHCNDHIVYRRIGAMGKDSHIYQKCDIIAPENIYIGDHSSIGAGALLMSSRAKIVIGNYVTFGPRVTCVSGNHVIDAIGYRIADVTDEVKNELEAESGMKYDADIVIGDDVWVGANATILAGVHVGEGCVIGAGAVVTKDTPPYTVCGGVPARVLKARFTPEQLEEHRRRIGQRNN